MSEKTEAPTHKKLADARKKGDVAHSKDASKALLVCGLLGYLIVYGRSITDELIAMVDWAGVNAYAPYRSILPAFLEMFADKLIAILGPFLLIVILLATLGEVLHIGIIFAPEKIKPSFKKLDVVSNVKNIFSAKNALEAVKSVIKVVVLTWVLTIIIRDNIGTLMLLPASGMQALSAAFGTLLRFILIATVITFIIVGIADIFLQHILFNKEQKMTKDEVKREYKESEGDPHIKHHRKHLHQEIVDGPSHQRVKRASAVVVNPVHFAVALGYERSEDEVPLVLAKGAGKHARHIVAVARSAGIPIVQNVTLARILMSDAELDDYVPDHLVDAVIETLKAVRHMGAAWD
jgi:type III secretion protein U